RADPYGAQRRLHAARQGHAVMKLPRAFGIFSGIFGRTFLLTLAALLVAVAVGITLAVTRPPMHNFPVRLSEVARQLSGGQFPGGQFPEGKSPNGNGRPGPPPPDNFGADRHGPPPGGPPGFPMGPGPVRKEWRIYDDKSAPESPRGTDAKASERLRASLAIR